MLFGAHDSQHCVRRERGISQNQQVLWMVQQFECLQLNTSWISSIFPAILSEKNPLKEDEYLDNKLYPHICLTLSLGFNKNRHVKVVAYLQATQLTAFCCLCFSKGTMSLWNNKETTCTVFTISTQLYSHYTIYLLIYMYLLTYLFIYLFIYLSIYLLIYLLNHFCTMGWTMVKAAGVGEIFSLVQCRCVNQFN